jgi:hypothetical protein
MTLGPERWCLLVGDVEILGPITGGRHGWPFGASIEDLAALGYVEEECIRRRYGSDVCTCSQLYVLPGRALERRAVSGGAIPDENVTGQSFLIDGGLFGAVHTGQPTG